MTSNLQSSGKNYEQETGIGGDYKCLSLLVRESDHSLCPPSVLRTVSSQSWLLVVKGIGATNVRVVAWMCPYSPSSISLHS